MGSGACFAFLVALECSSVYPFSLSLSSRRYSVFGKRKRKRIGRQRHLYLRVFFVFDYFIIKTKGKMQSPHSLQLKKKKQPDILYNISHLFFFLINYLTFFRS